MNEELEGLEEGQLQEELNKRPGWLFLIGSVQPPRPGVLEFITRLEYEYFKPGTPANDQFDLFLIKMCNGNLIFCLAAVPGDSRSNAENLAGRLGLRLDPSIPLVFGPSGPEKFPVAAENMFTLVNQPASGVYTKDWGSLIDEEGERIREIHEAHFEEVARKDFNDPEKRRVVAAIRRAKLQKDAEWCTSEVAAELVRGENGVDVRTLGINVIPGEKLDEVDDIYALVNRELGGKSSSTKPRCSLCEEDVIVSPGTPKRATLVCVSCFDGIDGHVS